MSSRGPDRVGRGRGAERGDGERLFCLDIFDLGAGRYLHMKMTHERFPRLLATRRIEEDEDAEYFGAFLTKTAVRILINFLNRTFSAANL